MMWLLLCRALIIYFTNIYKFQLCAKFSQTEQNIFYQNMPCPLMPLIFSSDILMPRAHFPPLFTLPSQQTQFSSSSISKGASSRPPSNGIRAVHLLHPSIHPAPSPLPLPRDYELPKIKGFVLFNFASSSRSRTSGA